MLRFLIIICLFVSIKVFSESWIEPKTEDMVLLKNEADTLISINEEKTDLFKSEVNKSNNYFSSYRSETSNSPFEQNLPPSFIDDHYKDLLTKDNYKDDAARPISSNILVFVTFSMKESDLVALGKDLAKLNGHLVFNGFHNDYKSTIKKVSDLIEKSGVTIPIMIDPTMFERFNISKVPVYIMPKDGISPCVTNDQCPVPENISSKGLVPVAYFLEKIIDSKNPDYLGRAEKWLKLL